MTLMPATGKAARDEWNALPEAVRRRALNAAARGEPAGDPAIAAIMAGALGARHSSGSWARRAVGSVPFAVVAGAAIALQYFGWLSISLSVETFGAAIAVGVGLFVAVAAVMGFVRNRRGNREGLSARAIPTYAELPNLRKVLETAPAAMAEPLVVRGTPHLRTFLLGTGVLGVVALGFIAVLGAAQPQPGDYHRLVFSPLALGAGAGLVSAFIPWARHLLYLPLRMDDAGLRFGLRTPIPWRDVLGLQWAGPTAAHPDARAGLVWRLRDRRDVRIGLDWVVTPPEQIVRTAEAYTGRRNLLT